MFSEYEPGPPPGSEDIDEDGPPGARVSTRGCKEKPKAPRWGRVPGYLVNDGLLENLSLKASKLLISLCLHGTNAQGKVWARMVTLVKETGLCEDSICKAKRELSAKGIIYFNWSPKFGAGHWIWLAHKAPGEFSEGCKNFMARRGGR